jgi:putative sterol carrier protein
MARFLTEEWAKEVRELVNADEGLISAVGEGSVCVLQIVRDLPDGGEMEYWFSFENSKFINGIGQPPGPPDATMQLTYQNAVALYKGMVKMQNAMIQGRLKITGNMGKLMQYSDALQPLVPLVGKATSEY